MHMYKQSLKKGTSVFCYVKLTNQILFKTRFPKYGTTYRKQVVNLWHQTGQDVWCFDGKSKWIPSEDIDKFIWYQATSSQCKKNMVSVSSSVHSA